MTNFAYGNNAGPAPSLSEATVTGNAIEGDGGVYANAVANLTLTPRS